MNLWSIIEISFFDMNYHIYIFILIVISFSIFVCFVILKLF